ncbi:MAG: putative cytochrome [Verrucomicrobiales bacterium]|nr:putative cytochrome [Verrucomicrobiales bacterium]
MKPPIAANDSDRVRANSGDPAGLIPNVPGSWFLGNTLQLFADPPGFFVAAYRKFGPIFRVKILGRNYTVLAGAEAVNFFLTEGEKCFSREQFFRQFAQELGTTNFVLGAQGAQHARLRMLMRLGFSRQMAAPHVPRIIEAIGARMRAWPAGQKLKVMETAAALAFEGYGWIMAGRSLSDYFTDACRFSMASMQVGAMVRPRAILSLPRYRKAKRRIFALMQELLAEHRQPMVEEDHVLDVIDSFLAAKDKEGSSLSEAELISSALYGFIGTLVYMNRLIAFLLYELLQNPQLLQQATDEVDSAFANGIPDFKTLRRMRMLHASYLETLRRHPIALGLPFLTKESLKFQGRIIERGEAVIISHIPIHFSETIYSNPLLFDPARCMEPRNEHRTPNGYAPFGCGGRVCAAGGLVEMITLVTVATLLRTVRLQITPPNYQLKVTLDPLPGPERDFTVRVVEQRAKVIPAGLPLPRLEEQLSGALPELNQKQLDDVLKKVKTATYQPGTVILRQDDVAEDFYIILEGEVEVLKQGPDREEKLVGRLRAGDYFGEIGLLYAVRRTATVRAAGKNTVKTLVLDRDTFTSMVADSDLLSDQIASVVRRRYMANLLAQALPRLNAEQIGRYLPDFELREYEAGSVIIEQGGPADTFFIITKGMVEVINSHPSGQDVLLGELGAGECFGEIGLLAARPRMATVRTKPDAPVEVMALGREAFSRLIADSSATREELAVIMSRRILAMTHPQSSFGHS